MTRNSRFLPYGRQSISEADIAAVVDVLRGDWLTTGPKVAEFEKRFAQVSDSPHAVACANGTAALHLAALALDLGPGDCAIVPTLSFSATANCVRYTGADVVFADVDPDTGLMGVSQAEEALAKVDGRRAKAIFPVHLAGQCADPAGIKALAEAHDLKVVEDACHAVGTRYTTKSSEEPARNYAVGACAHSDLATFSFHPVKTIATGEGGMVACADEALAARITTLRSHGITHDADSFAHTDAAFDGDVVNPWYYELQMLGFNYRLNDLQCALGVSQLSRLREFVSRRRQLADRYRVGLRSLAPLVRPMREETASEAAWHLFVVHVDFAALGKSRATVMNELRGLGIGTQVHYIPIHQQPYYRELYGPTDLPGADAYYATCLSLPLFPDMSEDDVDAVIEALAGTARQA